MLRLDEEDQLMGEFSLGIAIGRAACTLFRYEFLVLGGGGSRRTRSGRRRV
jgi:hypothetical protein